MSAILRDILESTKLTPAFCADLVGVDLGQFQEWLNSAGPLPRFIIPELSSILGVPEKTLLAGVGAKGRSHDSGMLAPAIWYKLRNDRLTEADRELVGLVRKLGYYLDQLYEIRAVRVRHFEVLFHSIRQQVDRTEPPAVQGTRAAQILRNTTDLQQGESGIGEWVRPTLRRLGILVVESPIKSSVEGCTFKVGTEEAETPCLFANSYRSTWFRRNAVILHELAHAIFDLENDPVTLDFRDEEQADFSELRAQMFAQEALVPRSVLIQIANRHGLHWDNLSAEDVARLISDSHAEQRLVLKAAFDAEFIDAEQKHAYSQYDCGAAVRQLNTHALSTREYLKTLAAESPKWIAENRNTNLGRRTLRLPSVYVGEVIKAFEESEISIGKAAEMLMMDQDVFRARFAPVQFAPAQPVE